jgi:NAD(P)-dependent dehydrogenase (short-subunit alcohol dehydrogenase family)
LHGLVNNAMTGMVIERFHKLPPDQFSRSFNENIAPVMRITQEVIRHFRKARFGKIVTVLTSYLACTPPVGVSEYVSLKAYLHSMAKSWACENARYGITSNCVSPSFMLTPLNRNADERVVAQMTASHPLERLLTPGETAQAVAFLMEATQQINGINLLINAAEHVV